MPLEARRRVYRLIEEAGAAGIAQDRLRAAMDDYTEAAFDARLRELEEAQAIRTEVRQVRTAGRRGRRLTFFFALDDQEART